MKIVAGLIAYNEATARYLSDFLPSLEAALAIFGPHNYRIYAYDNSGPENRANKRIIDKYPDIRYFTSGHNLGFAAAYNVMMAAAIQDGAEYFLVINPDTILQPDAVSRLARELDSDNSLGSVAPKILRWDFEGRRKTDTVDSLGIILKSGLRFIDCGQGFQDGADVSTPKILGPSGAAGLYRLSALSRVAEKRLESDLVQYFDSRFFMYKEDCDLDYRLFLAGYGSKLVPEAVVYHDRTAAVSGRGWRYFRRDRQAKSRLIRAWSFRNQHYIFLKYWRNQRFWDKLTIVWRVIILFSFSLILEQYLLKEYRYIWRLARELTNTK